MSVGSSNIFPGRQNSKEAGFTLIEVLSALVIIGLMSALVLINTPPAKPAALTQGEQLTRDLNRAAQNSLTTGAPYGFGMSKTGYGIYALREELWDLANEAAWDDDVTPALTLEGAAVKLGDTLAPMVVFEPTGMNAPFSVMLSGDDVRFEIISPGAGAITLEPRL